jgi:hypothetical protein
VRCQLRYSLISEFNSRQDPSRVESHEELAERIRKAVREAIASGVSVADLAARVGVTPASVYDYVSEGSTVRPYRKTLAKYEQVLSSPDTPVRGGTGTPADSATSAGPSGAPPGAFADGVLHAAYRMSVTLSELIAEAMQGRGLARPAGPPSGGAPRPAEHGPREAWEVFVPDTPPAANPNVPGS